MHATEARRIVTGVDFHESSWAAAVWVMRYFAPQAEHTLVHVVDLPELPAPLRRLAGATAEVRASAREHAEHRLVELRDLGSNPRVTLEVREGKPSQEILRVAGEVGADLIVIGEQGPTRGVAALLGSTAERVLFSSPVPVLLARKVADEPPRRLLVAVDASEMSGPVLAVGDDLLHRFDGAATVLNVIDRTLLVDEMRALPSAHLFERRSAEATAAMEAWLTARVREAGLPEDRVRTHVAVGDPSYEIISEAARGDADLVVLGSRGGDVARTPLIGRIVNKVVRSAPCSVLVVTRPERGG